MSKMERENPGNECVSFGFIIFNMSMKFSDVTCFISSFQKNGNTILMMDGENVILFFVFLDQTFVAHAATLVAAR